MELSTLESRLQDVAKKLMTGRNQQQQGAAAAQQAAQQQQQQGAPRPQMPVSNGFVAGGGAMPYYSQAQLGYAGGVQQRMGQPGAAGMVPVQPGQQPGAAAGAGTALAGFPGMQPGAAPAMGGLPMGGQQQQQQPGMIPGGAVPTDGSAVGIAAAPGQQQQPQPGAPGAALLRPQQALPGMGGPVMSNGAPVLLRGREQWPAGAQGGAVLNVRARHHQPLFL